MGGDKRMHVFVQFTLLPLGERRTFCLDPEDCHYIYFFIYLFSLSVNTLVSKTNVKKLNYFDFV